MANRPSSRPGPAAGSHEQFPSSTRGEESAHGLTPAASAALIAALRAYVAQFEKDPVVLRAAATADSGAAIPPQQYLTGIWEEALSSPRMDETRVRSILGRLTRQIEEVQMHAEHQAESVDSFVARWKSSPEFPESLAQEPPAGLRQRITRVIGGLYDLILARQSEEMQGRASVRFAIDWNQGGESCWIGGGAEPLSIRSATLQSVTLFGEFTGDVADSLTRQLLADLRTGRLMLPHFRVTDDARPERLVLEWQSPGMPDDELDDWPANAAEAELSLVQAQPVLADVLDQAICLAAVRDTAGSGDEAAAKLRALLCAEGGLSGREADRLLAAFSH
jgi:hypothetical protein